MSKSTSTTEWAQIVGAAAIGALALITLQKIFKKDPKLELEEDSNETNLKVERRMTKKDEEQLDLTKEKTFTMQKVK